MRASKYLIKEVKEFANSDTTVNIKKALRATRTDCSTPDIMTSFAQILAKHGRPATAIVIAMTLETRKDRIDGWMIGWADSIISAAKATTWDPEMYAITDNLHPLRIQEYAGKFIKLNAEME